jgi:hypothetical protein
MNVGICAIVKDCDPEYLREWIDWHKLIGVDYFFLFDNGSEIPVQNIVSDNPNIFVYLTPGTRMQQPVYMYCIYMQRWRCQPTCDWIAFIDDDEFIVVESGSIKELLSEVTSSGLALNWVVFGGTGEYKVEGSQIDKFTRHTFPEHEINQHVKSIVQPLSVEGTVNPHYFHYHTGECLDLSGNIITSPYTHTPVMEKAWINHYWNRSREEFLKKLQRGRVDCDYTWSMELYEGIEEKSNHTSTKIIEIRNKLLGIW